LQSGIKQHLYVWKINRQKEEVEDNHLEEGLQKVEYVTRPSRRRWTDEYRQAHIGVFNFCHTEWFKARSQGVSSTLPTSRK